MSEGDPIGLITAGPLMCTGLPVGANRAAETGNLNVPCVRWALLVFLLPIDSHPTLGFQRDHGEVLRGALFASDYFSFAYSALACFRIGMSGSAFFHSAKKSW